MKLSDVCFIVAGIMFTVSLFVESGQGKLQAVGLFFMSGGLLIAF